MLRESNWTICISPEIKQIVIDMMQACLKWIDVISSKGMHVQMRRRKASPEENPQRHKSQWDPHLKVEFRYVFRLRSRLSISERIAALRDFRTVCYRKKAWRWGSCYLDCNSTSYYSLSHNLCCHTAVQLNSSFWSIANQKICRRIMQRRMPCERQFSLSSGGCWYFSLTEHQKGKFCLCAEPLQ